MIVVTGAAGFIGSNLVQAINERGDETVLAVDNLSHGEKFQNLVDLDIVDYVDKEDFETQLKSDALPEVPSAIFHLGACSDTMEWDGRYMMRNNYDYSKLVYEYCARHQVQMIYASSASVYGGGEAFAEVAANEAPINVYGYSKLQFDRFVRRRAASALNQVVGLRFFNVYGPREQHKARMASVAYHFNQQVSEAGKAKLFAGYQGYENGEQRRDFVHVEDVCAVALWFFDHARTSGVFNVGTGRSQTFNEVAAAVIKWHQQGQIEYVDFPDALKSRYQCFTQACLAQLRAAGCDLDFMPVEVGVPRYLDWLRARELALLSPC